MAFRRKVVERLTSTGLPGSAPPRGSGGIPGSSMLPRRTTTSTCYTKSKRLRSPSALCSSRRRSVPIHESEDAVYKIAKRNSEVTFLRLEVEEEGIQEIVGQIDTSRLPTFYFYKGGDVVGKLIGSSPSKLEDLVVSFIHHKELRRHIRVNEF
ncbi:uncharacterized protein LOC9636986 isoform X2 [Selaginella moellendorffii]|uniref:uncharacterized protein LOC9636986 isoform X2 n=1 Tax=Selaginella moellendorffii TaxID=88036 RepID=UPI000D1C4EBD|nr:uncharacterized protein LOC9636986 isoform X2 [Selaginella moellendorffii]|eukprot:XP_024533354.1 uncharacterized protein LOC9636986 isoform X2 [Selaginella moellendorffii]